MSYDNNVDDAGDVEIYNMTRPMLMAMVILLLMYNCISITTSSNGRVVIIDIIIDLIILFIINNILISII